MSKLKIFWEEHDQRILTVLAIILTAVVSFQAGRFQQDEVNEPEIKVSIEQSGGNNPVSEKIAILGEAAERKGIEEPVVANTANEAECVLVGSKNSDKYHLPNCSYAARINPENLVCFSSKEDAGNRGYKPAGCCH